MRRAEVGRDDAGRPDVNFILTGEAGKRFGQFTAANIGNLLAVVLDKKSAKPPTSRARFTTRETFTETSLINQRPILRWYLTQAHCQQAFIILKTAL